MPKKGDRYEREVIFGTEKLWIKRFDYKSRWI